MPSVKANGAEIYYEEAGSGIPIILIPGGLQGILENYRPVIGGLSQHHRVISYDRRFGGKTRSPMVVQTWDLACGDVLGLMDSLDIDQAYLGGASLGPTIALGCAARHPERIRGLVLNNIAGGLILDVFLGHKLYSSLNIALLEGMKAAIDALDPKNWLAPFVPHQVGHDSEYRKVMEAMPPEEYAQVMRDTVYALFSPYDPVPGMTLETLGRIRVPTLIMPGYDDLHPRSVAETIHRNVPNSQWAEVRAPTEAPDQFVQRVAEFIAGAEAGFA